ncbi:MAG: cytochrome c [Gammaproteobacteria bacterium]|nr:cytochrome c [Gammaproteobacteria bacterium]
MKKSSLVTVSLAFAGLLNAGSALALDGKALFENPAKGGCTACHGKDANTPLMPLYPKLAGQNAAYAIQQFNDIKSGKRNNSQTAAMKGITHMASDEEIKAIAEYLQSLK